MATLNVGCGSRPLKGAVNLDRTLHDDWVDVAHDLNQLPWPFEDGQFDKVIATDVMEHLHLEVWQWLGECHRILKKGGELVLHLPAWNCESSYRDPTHNRVFHWESFKYWEPGEMLHELFGRFYPGSEQDRWWKNKGWQYDDMRPLDQIISSKLPGFDQAEISKFVTLLGALNLDRYVIRGDILYLLEKL